MANILDEQERKRKELAAQGIRTRGVAGAQGGSAEIGYVPPSRRNAPINQIPPQNASPQADYARSAEGGAMIPPDKVGQARMLGSMPNHGSLTPFKQPADTWIQRSRDFTQSRVGGTNQQLQMHRNEMGTTDTSLTQMAAQLDPSIRQDAERARQWRIMSPQQRRDEVDRLAMEQDARTADQLFAGTWEDIQKYARSLADPTGMFIDSYGRENPMYSPGTAERIRGYQRKIESAIARMMSSYDRTKWDSPQAFLDAVSALPEVIEAGEFGKSIVFNIVRKYATPTMRAQMEAEDRNMKLFEQAGTKKALEEIVQKMAQEGQVNPKYANGYRLTNDGTKELLRQVWLNKDNDPRAGYIVNEIMANAPVMWMEEGGRVVQDPAHEERRRVMLEQRNQQAAAAANEEELRALEEYEDKRYAAIQRINPERAAMMIKNPITRKYEDLNEYAPKKQEINWDEIYKNNALIAATESLLSWGRFRTEEEAAAAAARQFPLPDLPPNDPRYQAVLAQQQEAVDIWRTQVNPPEKRAELERELYNLKLHGQELRKGFKSPPAPEPTSGGYDLTMDSLGFGNQANRDQYSPVSVRQQSQTSPSITHNPASQSQPAYRETPLGSGKNQNRQNYEKAGTFRVGTLLDESTYEQYKATGRISVSYGEMDKIPIAVSVAGKYEYITMVDPGEFSSFMKKKAVGPVSPVKVRLIPISDIVATSVSQKEVERMQRRFGTTVFASKNQVLAVAADRINRKNKKRVHPFKNLLDWSPDLAWAQVPIQ